MKYPPLRANISALVVRLGASHVETQPLAEVRTELDSHADTCVVGKHALILMDFDRPVNVIGYDPSLGTTKDLRTVSAAIAYDDPETGETRVMVIHQAVHIPTLQHNLLCPMQLRMNDVEVNETPKFLLKNPSDESHSIVCRNESESPLRIPLEIYGVTSYFPTRKPTLEEYERAEVDGSTYTLTSESPAWDPHDTTFSTQEAAMTDSLGRLKVNYRQAPYRLFGTNVWPKENENTTNTRGRTPLGDISNIYDDTDLKDSMNESWRISSLSTSSKRQGIDAQTLAKNWGISLQKAERTLEVTTQRGVRTILHPSLSRRFRTNDRQLRYRRMTQTLYSDTLESSVKSYRGNKYAQVFGARNGWARAFPMKRKAEAHEALSLLFARDGVPPTMVVDGAKEETMGNFRKKAREADCHLKVTEYGSPWSNAAEGIIRELKRGTGRKMTETRAPKRFWDDCMELEALIKSNTVHDIYELQGQTPEAMISGQTPDISSLCEHKWYAWIKFWDTSVSFPDDKEILGRYLGPSIDIGPAMTAKILKKNGQVVHRSTYRAVTADEMKDPKMQEEMKAFDANIELKLGPGFDHEDMKDDPDIETPTYDPYEDQENQPHVVPDREDVQEEGYDPYTHAEVLLPSGDKMLTAKVMRPKRNRDGSMIGKGNVNPILDTRVYEVQFPDGHEAEFSANVIAESMLTQCDSEGNQFLLLDSIVDHKRETNALTKSNAYVTINGKRYLKKNTKGWKLCVQWKDGSTSWESLANLKESNPIEVAEYAISRELADEPAFAWWVPFTMRRRDRIIAAVNRRYHKRTHKFGLRLPKTVEEALEIDRENGNNLWQEAIDKEMKAVRVAFKVLDDGDSIPSNYQEIKCHMVFEIKMENFRRKARFVAGGHTTDTPATLTYASVVSRESVRIALTLAALNDLEIKTADIENAYLTAPVSERIWTILGPEFGEDVGKRAIVKRALYGLKSAGASFRNHLADCMRHLGYKSCLADQDLWLKEAVRPEDGFKYYAYVLLYVDDIMMIHHDATAAIKEVDQYFKMKPGSIADPDIYLGGKLRKCTLTNGVHAWGISSSKYIQEAVRNVETYLTKEYGEGKRVPRRAPTPMERDYRPELDHSAELGPKEANFYQSQIGILRWIVELGRIDIITEVSMLASQLAMPRKGHLEAVLRIFGYLKNKHNARMVFDPSYPDIDMRDFQEHDWKAFYGDAKEAIPDNAPEPRGKEIDLRIYVDSDHAGDKLTRRSRTGYLVYLNMAPIAWYSKRQSTIETSVFGAEFVAMKTSMEVMRGLRYKLRMMGVPLSGPTFMYGDNMSVIHNTQRPDSTLKKKSNSICYHAVRESVAIGECLTGHVRSAENPADICTKVVPGGALRDAHIRRVLYDLAD